MVSGLLLDPLYIKLNQREDKPIFILNEYDLLNEDESEDFLEILIKEIEEKINVKMSCNNFR